MPQNTDISLLDSSRQSAQQIAEELRCQPVLLSCAVAQAVSGIQPQSWRIARCIEIAVALQPGLLATIEPQILAALPSLPEQTLRSFLKMYKTSSAPISAQAANILLQLCFTLLEDSGSAVAVRAYSSQILERLTIQIPEIRDELIDLLLLLCEQNNSTLARGAKKTITRLRAY